MLLGLLDTEGWSQRMLDTPQSPEHHPEGDVWKHTAGVVAHALQQAGADHLTEEQKLTLVGAAILHDIGKPDTTKVDGENKISSPNHTSVGERISRDLLWRAGFPFHLREKVCSLVRYHMLIAHVEEMRKHKPIEVSQRVEPFLLNILHKSDLWGRTIYQLSAEEQLRGELFQLACEELGCYTRPYQFYNSWSRYMHFREHKAPDLQLHDASKNEMIMMCGLPGAGKTHYIRNKLSGVPVVSLDDIREEWGWPENGGGYAVVREALSRAKAYLRKKQNFVWDATSIIRAHRDQVHSLARNYGFRVRCVYVEAPMDTVLRQNKERDRVVPEEYVLKQMKRLEMPQVSEFYDVEYVVR